MKKNLKLRILELIRYAEGGMKEHYIRLVKGLKSRGLEVTALCHFAEKDMVDLRNYGIDVIPFPIEGELDLIDDLHAVKKVIRILEEHKVDILHCHGFKAGLIGRLAALKTRHPCVYTVHNFLPDNASKFKKNGAIWVEKILAPKTHAIITVSKALRNYEMDMLDISEDRVNVVYNGVEVPTPQEQEGYLDIRERLGISNKNLLVGTVARLIPSKGVDYLIEAVPDILKEYPDMKFVVVGGGPEEDKIKERVLSLGCTGKVIFTGYVEHIWRYYKAFDIFILPTLSEGLGISVLEAMASGKPVIASNVGGIPEIVEHGVNGYLIPPKNSRKIAEAVLYLASHPEERKKYGEAGYLTVKEKFSNEVMVERTMDILIKSAMDERKHLKDKDIAIEEIKT